ncbi:TIGR02444 family protein [Aliiglaciecola sp. 3_MG-2023]|uniref:TIGR02444 family protein n=1 Tax=Aliiglaciecola sp. 3_MG-2023 TaxID=3062644 RepID=UPI0026E14B16|nr:TIGR02444 family protein [Aliiglaciecola sp. 3_MG-2023]MDO6694378.1 TIGR02444 family protein [Aliiglaciecola sp. 3_MG-2023]
MNNKWLAEDFWQFSLFHYANSEVKRLALCLQNDYSLNVNLLLLCAFLDRHNRQLSVKQFIRLTKFIAQSVEEVEGIRKLRIEAKNPQPALYAQLLEQELQAEKAQQKQLIEFCNKTRLTKQAKSNFEHYLNSLEYQNNGDLKCILKQLAELICNNQTNPEI